VAWRELTALIQKNFMKLLIAPLTRIASKVSVTEDLLFAS